MKKKALPEFPGSGPHDQRIKTFSVQCPLHPFIIYFFNSVAHSHFDLIEGYHLATEFSNWGTFYQLFITQL